MLETFAARSVAQPTVDGPGGAGRRPLKLAVGAVSRAAVDAACDVAAYFGRPIYIVASRAQVGSFPSRPGYVEGWCIGDLVEYLRESGRRSHALIFRDHGGPLQHPEDGSSARLAESLNRACQAIAADVKGGADGVHLDLGTWIAAGGHAYDGLRRLVDACEGASDGRSLQYEVGIDPQSNAIATAEEVTAQLEAVRKVVPPTAATAFIVVQLGTLVLEDRNVGALELTGEDNVSRVEDAVAAARRVGVLPKAHNCDYLSPWSLRTLGAAGVYCNIAPQYATAQNRLLIRLLDLYSDHAVRKQLADLVRDNGGWRKWTADCEPTQTRLIELGAHYAMSHSDVRDGVAELEHRGRGAGLPGFDDLARRALRQLMLQQAATLEGVSMLC
jgi:hypothetical protein